VRLLVGSDHAGISLRRAIARHLLAGGHPDITEAEEVGPGDGERVDYPDPALAVASVVVSASAASPALGILICGSGIGMSIAANKVVGIRAALVHDPVTARLAAEHNGANVLCLGGRLLAEPYALELVDTWLAARFDARHQQRLDKIAAIELNRPLTQAG